MQKIDYNDAKVGFLFTENQNCRVRIRRWLTLRLAFQPVLNPIPTWLTFHLRCRFFSSTFLNNFPHPCTNMFSMLAINNSLRMLNVLFSIHHSLFRGPILRYQRVRKKFCIRYSNLWTFNGFLININVSGSFLIWTEHYIIMLSENPFWSWLHSLDVIRASKPSKINSWIRC